MDKYIIKELIEYNVDGVCKFLIPGDELLFVKEFESILDPSKTFVNLTTREKVVLYEDSFDKIERL